MVRLTIADFIIVLRNKKVYSRFLRVYYCFLGEKVNKYNNWTIQDNIYPLFEFVLPMFESLFGNAAMAKEGCEVFIDLNCTTAPITYYRPTRIVLKAEPCYYAQIIFQLAHELTHYAVRQNTSCQYENCVITAFEESAAEAMALYILKLSTEQWVDCSLYQISPNFAENFEKYRKDIYYTVSGNKPQNYDEWLTVCNGFTGKLTADWQRPNVSKIRNELYDAFVQFPDDIGSIAKYPLYIRNSPYEKLIDEDVWKVAEPSKSKFITAICAAQPMIL